MWWFSHSHSWSCSVNHTQKHLTSASTVAHPARVTWWAFRNGIILTMLTSLAIVTSLYLTNWKKVTWMWDMMILENKSLSKCLLNKIHHVIAASQNARFYMYSRNAIHLIRLQNVSVQPWTQPHLTASVAPSDCGALCRSVRIKPRLASTRRPTPSEDPLSKASTISIGNEKKRNKTCFCGKKTNRFLKASSILEDQFCFLQNPFVQYFVSTSLCTSMGIHASVQKRWSVRKRMVTSFHRGEARKRSKGSLWIEGNILKQKFQWYLEINSTWCFNMFHCWKIHFQNSQNEFKNFHQDTREAWSCCTNRWPPVSMPKRPGGSGIRGGREGTGSSWESWMTHSRSWDSKGLQKMHENQSNFSILCRTVWFCDKWSWLKAGLESMDCGQWLILNFLRGLCYSVMRSCWALCKTIWRNFVKECGNNLMNHWSPSLISEPSDLYLYLYLVS